MRKHNWHPKIIEDYLKKYYKNIESRNTARVYLKNFFTTMNKEPKQFLKQKPEDITKTLWKYAEEIENRPPKTQGSMLSFIKKFLIRNRIEILEVEWEDIRIRNNLKRKNRSITKKKTPTQHDLKKILSYATGIKSKTLFLFCACTGLRIDEALALTWDNLEMELRKIEVRDETGKGDLQRITFFTPETKELLELWKPERKKLLNRRYRTSVFVRKQLKKQGYDVKREKKYPHNIKNNEYTWNIYKNDKKLSKEEIIALDNRVFPFDYVNANKMWTKLLNKAGKPYNEIDKNPKLKFKKYLFNIHSLRRFFFTQMASDRANEELINFIGGHTSELNLAYKFEDIDNPLLVKHCKEEYDNHLDVISVFDTGLKLSEVNDEIQQLKEENKELRKDLEKFMRKTLLKQK